MQSIRAVVKNDKGWTNQKVWDNFWWSEPFTGGVALSGSVTQDTQLLFTDSVSNLDSLLGDAGSMKILSG